MEPNTWVGSNSRPWRSGGLKKMRPSADTGTRATGASVARARLAAGWTVGRWVSPDLAHDPRPSSADRERCSGNRVIGYTNEVLDGRDRRPRRSINLPQVPLQLARRKRPVALGSPGNCLTARGPRSLHTELPPTPWRSRNPPCCRPFTHGKDHHAERSLNLCKNQESFPVTPCHCYQWSFDLLMRFVIPDDVSNQSASYGRIEITPRDMSSRQTHMQGRLCLT